MDPELPGLARLLLLGGWTAVDSTSAGQFMVSRPLVAACLAGWALGDGAAGAAVGLLLEALHLAVLPVGAARVPEAGPAAVVGTVAYFALGGTSLALLTGVALAMTWQRLGGTSVHALRRWHTRLLRPAASDGVRPGLLGRWLALAVAADFLRGVTLVALGIAVVAVLRSVPLSPSATTEHVATIALGAAAVAGLAIAPQRLWPGLRAWMVAGVLLGALALWIV